MKRVVLFLAGFIGLAFNAMGQSEELPILDKSTVVVNTNPTDCEVCMTVVKPEALDSCILKFNNMMELLSDLYQINDILGEVNCRKNIPKEATFKTPFKKSKFRATFSRSVREINNKAIASQIIYHSDSDSMDFTLVYANGHKWMKMSLTTNELAKLINIIENRYKYEYFDSRNDISMR